VPVKTPGGGMVGQFGQDLLRSAVDTPGAYLALAKAGGQAMTGDPQAIRRLSKGLVHQVGQDVRHPLRHPGYTALDIAALASLAGAGALRAPATAKLVREAPRRTRVAVRHVHEKWAPSSRKRKRLAREAQQKQLGPDAAKVAKAAQRQKYQANLRREAKRQAPLMLRYLQTSPFGPLVYPPVKAARLAKASPSAKRTVDSVALATSTAATARRVKQAVARRNAMLAAAKIRTHR